MESYTWGQRADLKGTSIGQNWSNLRVKRIMAVIDNNKLDFLIPLVYSDTIRESIKERSSLQMNANL